MNIIARLSLVGLCAAGVVGIFLNRTRSGEPAIESKPEPPAAMQSIGALAVDQELISRAAEIGKLKHHAEREEAIAKLLKNATDAEFVAILDRVWSVYGKDLRLFQEIVDFWSKKRAESAARWAQTQTYITGKNARLLREKTGLAWLNGDKEAALRWMLTLSDREEKWGLAAQALSQVATHDPRLAINLLRKSGLSPKFQDSFSVRIFEVWAQYDPAAALAELGETVDNTYGPAYTNALSEWGRRDPDAAMSWLMSSPSGEIAGRADRLAQSNRPAIAIKLLAEHKKFTEKIWLNRR
jgi:hypothetical protein